MEPDQVAADKQDIREDVWARLRAAGAARFPGTRGRIPNFPGAERAAEHLADQPEWVESAVVKSNPDSPQWPARTRAVAADKRLYMAVPRLADQAPFLLLERHRLDVAPRGATSITGSARHARPIALSEMSRVELILCGSVAVDHAGRRLGKGGGFSDMEFGLLTEAGLVDDQTTIATTVHPVQVLDTELPETEHDFRVDLIVTPDKVIRPCSPRRPAGILWHHLEADRIAAIPALQQLHSAGDVGSY
ncbi:5-formyltetrahydrofolate cyclo-ligase [Lipingzhangella rawalii]|nr:5-formyltetrahydrofolate cyclo-ligase [Lipingzhangella rawalii]